MSRFTGPAPASRRLGTNIGAPTARTSPWRSALPLASTAAPAVGGNVSEYLLQLQEAEGQLRLRHDREAVPQPLRGGDRRQGVTGENLLRYCEQRLDNVVYRATWAATRPQARQFVTHGHVEVNGRQANVPSYRVRKGRRHPPSREVPPDAGHPVEHGHPRSLGLAVTRPTAVGGPPSGSSRCRAHRRPGEQLIVELLLPAEGLSPPTSPARPPSTEVRIRCVIQRPTVEAIDEEEANRQRFAISPLEPGFGHTLGNPCAAPSVVHPGAASPRSASTTPCTRFDTLTGVTEDVTDIILNLEGTWCSPLLRPTSR